jgi:hypothetical protein
MQSRAAKRWQALGDRNVSRYDFLVEHVAFIECDVVQTQGLQITEDEGPWRATHLPATW